MSTMCSSVSRLFSALSSASSLIFLTLLLPSKAESSFKDVNETDKQIRNCSINIIDETTLLGTVSHHFGRVHGHLSAAVCIFGMFANFANVIVLTRKDMASSSTNRILMWLAIADLAMFIVYFPQVVHFNLLRPPDTPYLHTSSTTWVKFSEFAVSFALICHASAVWLTVLLALFRYLYIALPTRGPSIATLRNANIGSVTVILTAAILTIPNIIMNEVQNCMHRGVDQDMMMYEISVSRNKPSLNVINFWLQALVNKIIPSVCLTVFTILLIKEMRKAARRRAALKGRNEKHNSSRENRTTLMLLTIVLLFLITVMPNGILICLSNQSEYIMMYVYMPLGDFFDLFALVNESINFILYTTMSQQFRQTFCQIFCPKCIAIQQQTWTSVASQRNKRNNNSSNAHNGKKVNNQPVSDVTCLVAEKGTSTKSCLVVHSNCDGSSGELSSTV